MKRFESLISDLLIKNVLIIDDEIYMDYEDRIEPALQIIEQYSEEDEFRVLFNDLVNDEDLNLLLEERQYDFLYDDENKRNIVLDIVTKFKPEMFRGNAYHIFEKLRTNLAQLNVECIVDPRSNPKNPISEYDLIFMDYEYGHDYNALKALEDLGLNRESLNYVIFLSSKGTFTHTDGKEYNMKDPETKQELFRNIRSDNSERFVALLSYINKQVTGDSNEFLKEIYHILLEFESGKIMVDSIDSLTGLLKIGIDDIKKQLMLTNTKTMKALITDKLETEGISETTYLVDFSLSMVKNLVFEKISKLNEIHDSLKKIQGWECEIWDFETDTHMRSLRELQLLDKKVSERHAQIDFGDIFTFNINNRETKGILITQSCDLIVRKNKDRISRQADQSMLILEDTEYKDSKAKGYLPMRIGSQEIVWNLRKRIIIPTLLLDFTTLSSNGNAIIKMNKAVARKVSWSNFYTQYINNALEEVEKNVKNLEDGIQLYWENGMAYPYEKKGNMLDFNIKRISRLDYLYALSIYKEYSDLESRVPLNLDPSEDILSLQIINAKLNKKDTELKFYIGEAGKTVYCNLDHFIDVLNKETAGVSRGLLDEIDKRFCDKHYLVKQELGTRYLIIDPTKVVPIFRDFGVKIETKRDLMTVFVEYSPKLNQARKEIAVTLSEEDGKNEC